MDNLELCPKCNRSRPKPWVATKIDGAIALVCKACAEETAVDNMAFYEKSKLRVEAERKSKNAKIIKGLKKNSRKR